MPIKALTSLLVHWKSRSKHLRYSPHLCTEYAYHQKDSKHVQANAEYAHEVTDPSNSFPVLDRGLGVIVADLIECVHAPHREM